MYLVTISKKQRKKKESKESVSRLIVYVMCLFLKNVLSADIVIGFFKLPNINICISYKNPEFVRLLLVLSSTVYAGLKETLLGKWVLMFLFLKGHSQFYC